MNQILNELMQRIEAKIMDQIRNELIQKMWNELKIDPKFSHRFDLN